MSIITAVAYQIPGFTDALIEGTSDGGPFGTVSSGEGFIDVGGTVMTIAVPGNTNTVILGANASGGTAYGYADLVTSGTVSRTYFVDVGGAITLLPSSDMPVGVDNHGDVLVDVAAANPNASFTSFLLNNGVATQVTMDGLQVEATAISPSGVLAGAVYTLEPYPIVSQYFVGQPGAKAVYAYPSEGQQTNETPESVNDSGAVGLAGAAFGYAAVALNGAVEEFYYAGHPTPQVVAVNAEGDALVVAFDNAFLLTPDGQVDPITAPGFQFATFTGLDDAGDIYGVGEVEPGSPEVSIVAELPCFAAGTLISTPSGETVVEALRVGDLVRTAGGDPRPIVWTGHRHVDLAAHPDPAVARPVLIRRSAFAPGVPARDLRVSPDHNIAFEDVLMPAKCLVDGLNVVVDTGASSVTDYHLELETHDLLLAEGLAAESFLDVGNRAALSPDADGTADFSSSVDTHWFRWEALGCRRLVLAGPALDRARTALRARAIGGAKLLPHRSAAMRARRTASDAAAA